MSQTIVQVDAFTTTPFKGNPAAVCVLPELRSHEWMQNVAQEMNLPETAFLIQQPDGFNLRWFTPTVEVPLCGHATLASAHVLWSEGHLLPGQPARFHTQSGLLIACKQNDWIELDFPVNRPEPTTVPTPLDNVLGISIESVKAVLQDSLGYLVEVESEALVRQMQPDLNLMLQLPIANVIVTSVADANSEFDFVSRFFAPGLGIPEDPVTGAAHCRLAPYWRDRLGKDTFLAYQASKRGGILKIRYDGDDRVYLSGQAVTVLRGELSEEQK
ncbi:PhzF family phenazine biosynthesis protein [Myxacorys almedinensis]|uniref:PhzF family phenazine biosynthesis isomerase n=1 Tax=Myxacorys almedinensis A TaxID=2690445 RepID=A0A8J7Z0G0_9CYAN|nr:PhzF family phenazine biosynthesis protein [Myxacorys almedinensis]NDJ17864.1 PhzF family phenazine biosynthesis isomerase [Myxacorys almedinensis A]